MYSQVVNHINPSWIPMAMWVQFQPLKFHHHEEREHYPRGEITYNIF